MTMDGRMISNAVNQQADIIPYMANDKMVVFIALLCGVIAIVGFVSVLPWGCMLRLYDSYVAAKLANTGLNNFFIESLPSVVYSTARSEITDLVGDAECPICLAEFVEGQKLRVLPKCRHSFHVECVDKWFGSHSSCPTCRNCLLGREEDRGVQFSKSQIQWSGSDGSVDENEKQRRSPEITDIVVIN